MIDTTPTRVPPAGERTGAPRRPFAAFRSDPPGFGRPPQGTYDTYRRIRANPTVALARGIATAPVRTAEWALQARDDVDDARVAFIQRQVAAFWPALVRDALLALDYGWQPFEKVFAVRGGRVVYAALKPLLPDCTEILLTREHGHFAGLRQDDVTLPPEKCFVFTHDGEAGNPYGRSRHENIRAAAWHPWNELADKQARYATKVAGVIPLIRYPVGESADAGGAVAGNYDIAVGILRSLGRGEGVAMPQDYAPWAGDLARQGIDPQALAAWQISFLEPSGSHGGEFAEMMRHYESLMFRGWLVPERAGAEGVHGTRADADRHADVALLIADLVLEDLIQAVNAGLVDPLLTYNFGPEAAGSVWIRRGGLDPALRTFFRDVIRQVLATGPGPDLFRRWLDVDALIDAAGLPKAREIVPAATEGT